MVLKLPSKSPLFWRQKNTYVGIFPWNTSVILIIWPGDVIGLMISSGRWIKYGAGDFLRRKSPTLESRLIWCTPISILSLNNSWNREAEFLEVENPKNTRNTSSNKTQKWNHGAFNTNVEILHKLRKNNIIITGKTFAISDMISGRPLTCCSSKPITRTM